MIAKARAQLARYPNVTFVDDLVVDARAEAGEVAADLRSGASLSGRKAVLAAADGVRAAAR